MQISIGSPALLVFTLALFFRALWGQDQVEVISGDVTFGALFQVNDLDNGVCGEFSSESLQDVVAVTWFLKSLNNRGYIPGVKIGLDVSRTCSSTERAVNGALRLLNDYRVGDAASPPRVLFGLLGPERTEEVTFVSRWLNSLPHSKRLFQISGSATGMELRNATYPNFFRVIPSDRTQVKVLAQLLVQLDWNYVAIAYDDDNYGSSMAEELRRLAEERDICIPVYVSLPVDTRSTAFETRASGIIQQMSSTENGLVRGIVIVGSSSTIRRLIQKLGDHTSYVSLVLGETAALQQQNFQTPTGQLVSIARGALVTSPPYFPLPEFQSFWNSLWANQTLFVDYARTIPWLAAFFQQVVGCNFTLSACWNGKRDVISTLTFGNGVGNGVSLYTWYHLKAAGVMAAFLKQEQTMRCSQSNISVCSDFIAFVTDRTAVLERLRYSTISLTELQPEIASFANVTSVVFDTNGDVSGEDGDVDYTVYSFQQENGRNFAFKQVASHANDQLTVTESDAIFYSESGSPLSWSQRPLAQCDANHDCGKCENDVADDVVFIEGDFYVVGILAMHEKNPQSALKCGNIKTLESADLAESLVFAVKQINKREGIFKGILPGRTIGLLVINSCSSPLLVRQRLLDLHTGRLLLPDPSMRNSSVILSNIMGYVGGYFSGDSIAAADILTAIARPFVQVSAASTSPDLKDRLKYPYFMRLVPPDDVQAQVMLDVAARLNSTYLQIIYDKTTAYANGLVQKLEEALANNYSNACIAQKIATTPRSDVSEYKWVKDELRKKSAARVVIVILHETEIKKLMNAILPELTPNDNFVFLASESWGRHQELIEGKTKLEGSLVLAQEIPIDVTFDTYFKSLNPTQTENVWLRYFWQARKSCYFDKSFERKGKSGPCPDDIAVDYVDDPRASLHIQATYALVIGFNQTLNQLCGPLARYLCDALTSDELVRSLKSVRLDVYNTGERTQVFDDNGDGMVGFKILQVTLDRTASHEAVAYREVGSWAHQTLTLNERQLMPLGGEKFSSSCPNEAECSECSSRYYRTSPVSSGGENASNISAMVGVSVAFAVTVVLLAIVIVCMYRRLRTNGQERRNVSYTAGAGDYDTTVQISSNSGYSNESGEAGLSEQYECLRNSEIQGFSGNSRPAADSEHTADFKTSCPPPPVCKVSSLTGSTGYITPASRKF